MNDSIYPGNSKSGYIKAMPLEDYEAMKRELAALRNIVRALTEADDAGVVISMNTRRCSYCGAAEPAGGSAFRHGALCPILAGRSALLNIDRQWEQMRPTGKEFGAEQEGANDGE